MLLLRLTSRSGQEYCVKSALARETGVKNQGMMGGAGNMTDEAATRTRFDPSLYSPEQLAQIEAMLRIVAATQPA